MLTRLPGSRLFITPRASGRMSPLLSYNFDCGRLLYLSTPTLTTVFATPYSANQFQLTAWMETHDRTEALRVLRKALDGYHVVGVSTNVEFLRTLAGTKAFINGQV